ncbi:C-C motif chemokine 19-like [Rhinatrema bivittatum]|uniref:C-C motif chemokine 19-like n=1 Tax=Rhinatrema bivittatum TaxID=194408 RepID=UPI0011265199|nr:C-C motif chemokine 19-like [Rhinatrema bivittatum]
MALRISLLCLVTLCCWKSAQVSGYISTPDCCLKVSPTRITYSMVKDYRIQKADYNCIISAVVFITKKDKHLCASPDAPWVERLIARLKKAKVKSKNNHQHRHHQKTA